MTGGRDNYESYVHEHELTPKWANLVSRVLTPKPSDSAWTKAARFGGLVTSPVWAPVPTLAAHAHDEIMYNPFTGFLGMPGYLQYKGSRALFGPTPKYLPPSQKITLPPRPFSFTTIPKVRVADPPRVAVRTQPPPRPAFSNISTRSMVNNLRIAEPSWKLKLNSTYHPPPTISTRMTLTSIPLGSSLPYRPFASNLGVGVPSLTLRNF